MTIPTDAELQALLPTKQLERNKEPKVQVWLTQKDALEFARAVLAKWGQPQAGASGEPVYAFRRKGLDNFCTCDEKRYAELSTKPNLFEVRVFYTAPPPASRAGATSQRGSMARAM